MVIIPFPLTTLLYYTHFGNLPSRGCAILDELLSLVIAPIFVGIVIQLVSHWLDEKDND
ncbi:type I toxin-antitoxin system Fst family toxin [Listeria seeligeri]|nr:type I toxin-antitoxin system Fst family toxin [Listeria seeligeri]MBM5609780.1 type I toxin-antitoxin system Fst family toxin [Listeria seeligeri]